MPRNSSQIQEAKVVGQREETCKFTKLEVSKALSPLLVEQEENEYRRLEPNDQPTNLP